MNPYVNYSIINSTVNGLVYEFSGWDYQQWCDYIHSSFDEYEKVRRIGITKTELFPLFMAEVFNRLLKGDNLDKAFDTQETYKIKLEKWSDEVKEWEADKQDTGLSDDDYIRICGDKPEKPEQVMIKNEALWALKLHESLDDSDEWLKLMAEISSEKNYLKQWILAGTGALAFSEKCAAMIPTPQRPLTDPQKLRDRLKELKENSDENNDEKIKNIITQGKKEKIEYENFLRQVRPLSDAIADNSSINAQEAVEQMKAVLSLQDATGWGQGDTESGLSQAQNAEEKLKNAKNLLKSTKFKKIIQQAGRLALLAEAKRKSKIPLQTTITGVKTGDNLFNLLPTEYARFSHTKTRPLFYKDYSERALLEFEKHSNDKAQKGPIVMLIDTSSSMRGVNELWSKAVAVAYLMVASKDKRDFYVTFFNTRVVGTFEFVKGKYDDSTLIKFIEFFTGGNTAWDKPLDNAVNIIKNSQLYKNGDIVMITDGLCNVHDSWLSEFKKHKEELKFTAYGVLLNSLNKEPLTKIMDKTIAISSVNNTSKSDIILEVF